MAANLPTAGLVEASIIDVAQESPRVVGLRVQAPEGYSWDPGQHLALCAAREGAPAGYYSIASAPRPEAPGVFELAAAADSLPEGVAAQEGELVWLSPPGGELTLSRLWRGAAMVLIGMGTGVSPLRAMAQFLHDRDALDRVTLLHGARTERDLLFSEEFRKYSDAGMEYVPVLSRPYDGWSGRRGRVQAHLDHLDVSSRFLLCGSQTMVREVTALLLKRGVSPDRIDGEGY